MHSRQGLPVDSGADPALSGTFAWQNSKQHRDQMQRSARRCQVCAESLASQLAEMQAGLGSELRSHSMAADCNFDDTGTKFSNSEAPRSRRRPCRVAT